MKKLKCFFTFRLNTVNQKQQHQQHGNDIYYP